MEWHETIASAGSMQWHRRLSFIGCVFFRGFSM
jgi:hypothetical protein